MNYDNCRDRTEWNKGRKDKRAGKGMLSSNGSYLNGWQYEHDLINEVRQEIT